MNFTKKNIAGAAFWSGFDLFSQQFIQFFVSIILARLLGPSEFGLIAMLSIFTSCATILVEGGFTGALIQRKNVSNRDKSTVFWYNIFIGFLLAGALYASASFIADFFNEPRLVLIARWSTLIFMLNGMGMVHRAMLQKELRFKEIALASLISVVISGVVSISMALSGFGVWALVAQSIIIYFFQSFMLCVFYRWFPSRMFDWKSFKSMAMFGHNLMLSMIVRTVFQNIYQVVIGKYFLPADLGYYFRSKRFSMLASQMPTTVISRVVFPALSNMRENKEGLEEGYKKFLGLAVRVVFPLLCGMAITAPNFVNVLVGDKWMPCVPYLQVLCVTGLFFPVNIISYSLLNAMGNSRASLVSEASMYLLIAISIGLLLQSGILALLIGQAVVGGIATLSLLFYIAKKIGFSPLKPLIWLAPILICCSIMVMVVAHVLPLQISVSSLMLKIAVGGFVYITSLVLFKDKIVISTLYTLKKFVIRFLNAG